MRRVALVAVVLFVSGCYASHELGEGIGGCPDSMLPSCTTPTSDPCGPQGPVTPVCVGTRWECPPGTRPYAHVPSTSDPCLPFHDPSMGIRHLGGSLPRIPTPDGRCVWIGDSVTTTSGTDVSDVGFVVDTTVPFGTCPTSAPTLTGSLESAVVLEGVADPSAYIVQIAGGWLDGGETRVLYRLFHYDPAGGFGVTEDGTGIGRWDTTRDRIVVGGPSALRWTPDVDLGDAVLVSWGERSYTYVWGCPPPIHDLVEDCVLARLGPGLATTEYFLPTGWSATMTPPAATTFAQGPWLGSVTASVWGFSHIYAAGFGTTLEQDMAPYPYGVWAPRPTIARCATPSSDDHAYCAGPVVHEEIRDWTRSDEVPVTYGLGTTDSPGTRIDADPDAYWTRLAWVRLP